MMSAFRLVEGVHQRPGKLGLLPLPCGERVGVRGFVSLDRPKPLTPPLSLWEREQTEIVARAWAAIERERRSS